MVNRVIVGEDCPETISAALKGFGIEVLSCPKNPLVDKRLCSHADLSVFHCGGQRFVLCKTLNNTAFAELLRSFGAEIVFSDFEQGSAYPSDAGLCALSVGDLVFHNEKFCDPKIRRYCTSFVNVGQGYAKCAVCVVSDTAVICADEGMARSMRAQGIDVLKISPGGVFLDGFNEGFIGGASFKISSDTIAFTGSLTAHPEKDKILCFLARYGVEPIFLSDAPLIDVGSVIPTTEIACFEYTKQPSKTRND